jgi:hypothetical protein
MPAPVAHTCNPSYSGGRDQDWSSKPAYANSSWDPTLKHPSKKKSWCKIVLSVGSVFFPFENFENTEHNYMYLSSPEWTAVKSYFSRLFACHGRLYNWFKIIHVPSWENYKPYSPLPCDIGDTAPFIVGLGTWLVRIKVWVLLPAWFFCFSWKELLLNKNGMKTCRASLGDLQLGWQGTNRALWLQTCGLENAVCYCSTSFLFCIILVFFLLLLFFFDGTKVCTQGFTLANQELYSLSHTSCPLCSGYFGDGGL